MGYNHQYMVPSQKRQTSLFVILLVFLSIVFVSLFSSSASAVDMEAVLDSNDGSSVFEIQDSDNNEVFNVDSDGNVTADGTLGVGTSAPRGQLEVQGNVYVEGSGLLGIGTTAPSDSLTIDGSTADDGIKIGVDGGGINRPHLEFEKGNTGQDWSIVSGVNSHLYIKPDLADTDTSDADAAITITTGGNIAIGTTVVRGGLDITSGDVYIDSSGSGTFNSQGANTDLYVQGNLEVDGVIYGSVSGSASTSIADGDANTIVDTDAVNDTITFDTAGSRRAVIDQNGDVGIGSTDPRGLLEVTGGDVYIGTIVPDNLSASDDLLVEGNIETDDSIYVDSGIYTDGAIVIGTGGANRKLTIYQDADNEAIRIYGFDDENDDYLDIYINSQGTSVLNSQKGGADADVFFGTGAFLAADKDLSFGGTQQFSMKYVSASDTFVFQDNNQANTRMAVDGSGNVGIGSTAPRGGLDVSSGDVYIDSSGSGTFNSQGASSDLYIRGNLEVDGTIYGMVSGSASSSIADGDSTTVVDTDDESETITFDTNSTRRMVIDENGDIGIGTTAPRGLLEVTGGDVYIGTIIPNFASASDDLFVEGNVETDDSIYVAQHLYVDGGIGIGTDVAQGNIHINHGFGESSAIVLGDGDSSIYEFSDDLIMIKAGGAGGISINNSSPQPVQHKASGNSFRMTRPTATTMPMYTSRADENTGFTPGYSGDDIIRFINAGAETVFIDATGQLGIGSSAPRSSLDVSGGDVYIDSSGSGTFNNQAASSDLYVRGNLEVDGTIYGMVSGSASSSIADGDSTTVVDTDEASETITFDTQGTRKMVIQPGGRVGIGSSVPRALLEVAGNVYVDGGAIGIGSTNLAQELDVAGGVYVSGAIGIASSDPAQELDIDGNLYMTGNIGIGSSDPDYKLTLRQTADLNGIRVYGFDDQSSQSFDIAIQSNGRSRLLASDNLQIFANSTQVLALTGSSISLNQDALAYQDLRFGSSGLYAMGYDATDDSLRIANGTSFAVDADVMMVFDDIGIGIGTTASRGELDVIGNIYASTAIGIGTTSPRGVLDVAASGDVYIDSSGTFNNAGASNDLYVQGNIEFDGTIYGDGSNLTGVSASAATQIEDSDQTTVVDTEDVAETITFDTNSTRRMVIDENGDVGIGTTAPRGLLEVTGGDVYVGTIVPNFATASDDLFVEGNLEIDDSLYIAENLYLDGGMGIGTSVGSGELMVYSPGKASIRAVDPTGYSTSIYTSEGAFPTPVYAFGLGTSVVTPSGASVWLHANASESLIRMQSTATRYNTFYNHADNAKGFRFTNNARNTTYLSIQKTGEVGVAITNPLQELHVVGDIYVTSSIGIASSAPRGVLDVAASGDVYIDTSGTFNNASPSNDLYVQGNIEFDGAIYGDGSNLTGVSASAATQIEDSDQTTIVDTEDVAETITFDTQGTRKMVIQPGGRVGIGSSVPRALLEVAGNVYVGNSGGIGIGSTALQGLLDVAGGDVYLGSASTDSASAKEDLFVDGNVEIDQGLYAEVVGIGQSAPSALVDIADTMTATDRTLEVNTTMTPSSSSTMSGIQLNNAVTGSTSTSAIYGILNSNNLASYTGTVSTYYGQSIAIQGNTGSPNVANLYGSSVAITSGTGGGAFSNIIGNYAVLGSGSGTTASVDGFLSNIVNLGTITNMRHFRATNALGGTIGAQTGLKVENLTGATISTAYGIYIDDQILSTPTNSDYAIYVEGGKSYFGDRMGIGTTAPRAPLEVVGNVYLDNVGIGTTNPKAVLDVAGGDVYIDSSGTFDNAGASNDLYVQGNLEVDGTIYGTLSVATTWDNIGDPSANATINFGTTQQTIQSELDDNGGGTALKIEFTEAFGAGTDDVYGLQIDAVQDDDANFYPILIRDDTGGTPDTLFRVDRRGGLTLDDELRIGSGNNIRWGGTEVLRFGSVAGTLEVGIHAGHTNTTFDTKATERMRINPAGYVGIGTSDPQGLLEVNGGNIYTDGTIGIGSTVPRGGLDVASGDVYVDNDLYMDGLISLSATDTESITAIGGVTPSRQIVKIQGSGGAVNISANPQISDGFDGQVLIIKGESDANTVLFEDGTGLALNADTSFTVGAGDTLMMMYDSGDDTWYELSRSDN